MSESPYNWQTESNEREDFQRWGTAAPPAKLTASVVLEGILAATAPIFLSVVALSLASSYLWQRMVAPSTGIDTDVAAWFGVYSIVFVWNGVKAFLSADTLNRKVSSGVITVMSFLTAVVVAAILV